MYWPQLPYFTSLVISLILLMILARFSWHLRKTETGHSLILLLCALSIWVLGYIFEISFEPLTSKLFWVQVQYFGIAFVPLLLFRFSCAYTGFCNRFLTFKRILTLALFPLLTLLLVWTNPWHFLFWRSIGVSQVGNVTFLELQYGVWFWINLIVSYLLILISTIFFFYSFYHTVRIYRTQRILLLIGILAPWAANILYFLDVSPFEYFDFTPFLFAVTAIFWTHGTLRFHLFDIQPIFRDSLVEKWYVGILVLDIQNRIVDINESATKMLGVQKDDVVGRPFTVLIEIIPQITTIIETSMQNMLFEITLPDGTICELHNEPYSDNQGQIYRRLLTLHNVTTYKQQENTLIKAKELAEAEQKKTETALKETQLAAHAKDNFLNAMSHEIRTPLGAVIGMSNLLRDTPLNSEQQELVKGINSSSDALLDIINNVLEYAKIESGGLQLNNLSFDLRDSLQTTIDQFAILAHEKALKLEYSIDFELPNLFLGDVVRLRQIIVNLLNNAIKFTKEGGIFLSIKSQLMPSQRYELHFSVKDSGIGISDSYIPHLFTPFSQEDHSMTRAYGGIGLGLAICKELCEKMDGKIWVDSQLGKGSTFHFTAVFAESAESPVHFLQPSQPSLRGKCLLIVANNTEDRRAVSREARAAGMVIYVANSTPEVEYWLDEKNFDGAFIENKLLSAEDDSLLPTIRAKVPNLPLILFMTDDDQDKSINDHIFSEFINSPVTASNLYETLVNVFATTGKSKQHRKNRSNANIATMANRHPLKLLLVEDNLINQKVLKGLLNRLGYTIEIANNGKEGVDKARNGKFDAILMDIQMPIMDGMEATKCIRKEVADEMQPRIIAVTANAMEGDRELYLSCGMDDYISKPVRLNVLIDTLYRCPSANGRFDSYVDVNGPNYESSYPAL